MLVITRRRNDKIVINGDVVITVVRINGDQVRLGISAPPGVRIDREEVFEERKAGRFKTQEGDKQ